jgi:hypothetical protein
LRDLQSTGVGSISPDWRRHHGKLMLSRIERKSSGVSENDLPVINPKAEWSVCTAAR